jgi:branched-chain amino acid transport system ATP-binding protein
MMRAFVRRLGLADLGAGYAILPLLVLFGLNAVDELDQSAFNVLAPEIRHAFGLSNTGIVAVRVALIPILPLAGVAIGYLADRSNRTRLAAIGALVWAAFSIMTGSVSSIAFLVIARAGAGLGRQVNLPTHQGLIADHYPPQARAGVYSFWRLANPVGLILGPVLAGLIGAAFGWRTPFYVFALPTVCLALLAFRLHEPIRGVHERRARGADEELASVEEDAPTWEESWRTVTGVATLRRVWRALPCLVGGILGVAILMPLYYDNVFGISERMRGVLAAANEPFQIVGLLVGIPIATRMIRSRPWRVLTLFAAAATSAGTGFVIIAVAPAPAVAVLGSAVVSFSIASLTPGIATLISLIVPPRARGFAFSVNELWALPGLAFVLIAARIGDAFGFRWAVATMTPVFCSGAYIVASAGGHVVSDIKAAQLAAMARAEAKKSRDDGEAKLLVCRGIDVRYGQVQVLFGVDLDIADGEIVALLGTNGAGKSTLLKAIAGLVDPSGGAVVFDGRDVTHASARFAAQSGIVLMPGGRGVFPTLTVRENLTAAAWLLPDGADQQIGRVLEHFPILRERMDRPAGDLSGGERQMLALGMAFVLRPRLLLIDELSLGLAPRVVERLLDVVREIHQGGATVVIVEQSVNVALTIAQRAVFMEKGEIRFSGKTRDLLRRPDVLRSVFLEGAAKALGTNTGRAKPRRARATADGAIVLETKGLSKHYGGVVAVDGVDLQLRAGSITGFIGPNGAGKTTLFDLISGFVIADDGTVVLDGTDVTSRPAHARARMRLGRSFQDARLFPTLTVREVLALAFDRRIHHRGVIAPLLALPDQRIEERLVQRRVDDLVELVGLQAFANKFVGELSTGSRRIVDIACAIAHAPRVLLLDEPSSGIAQRETEALGPLLRSINQDADMTLLVIEHDMPLITEVSDVLIAMDLGRVVTTGHPADVVRNPHVVASYLGGNRRVIARSGR